MRILTFNWHTPYNAMLAKLENHDFEIAPPNTHVDMGLTSWDHTMRPAPKNVTPISHEDAKERLAKNNYYDLVIAHNVKDISATVDRDLPKILVFHNKLSTEASLGNNSDLVDDYRQNVKTLISGIYCIFIAQSKRHDWGLSGEIIMPGIDLADYADEGGYNGSVGCVLRVGNSMKVRDLMTGYSLGEEVLSGLPGLILGANPDIEGCRVSKDWAELKKAYRDNRLLLNTSMPPYEDGYNLAVLEAMATGMPVVSIANPTSPFTNGLDGLVGNNATEMRKAVRDLLANKERAAEIGARGRESAEKLFPMERFLEKWDRAIKRIVEWHPRPAHDVFNEGKYEVLAPAFIKRKKGKNILLSYTAYPATAGAYLECGFKQKHDLVTAGGTITEGIVKLWNLEKMENPIRPHMIPALDLTIDVEFMLDSLPAGFTPDFFLWVETGLGREPKGLRLIDVPKGAYFIDTHLHLKKHLEQARKFDVIFLAQRAYIDRFKEAGISDVHWLPLACDPDIHGKQDVPKSVEVGFAGTLADERRARLLMKLAMKAEVKNQRCFLGKMAEHFCRSKIVFNNAIKNDLNMRVFEAMATGSMLLTDMADGLTDFFEDKKHLVIYDDENIGDLARYYLDHQAERERIGEAGRQEVLARHTYAHRCDEIVNVMQQF